MSSRLSIFAGLAVLFIANVGLAQAVYYYPDRPITMPKGTSQASVNLFVDLQKGFEGEAFGVGSGLVNDRANGLVFRAGVLKNFELGMSLAFHYTMSDGAKYRPQSSTGETADIAPEEFAGPEGNGVRRLAGWPTTYGNGSSHLNPLYLYARYAFLDQLGLEFGLIVPTDPCDGLNRPGFRLGVPVKYVIFPGLLSIHARPDLLITFASVSDHWNSPESTVLLTFYADAGITFSLLSLFLDVSVAYGTDVYPYHKGHVPMTFLLGYTFSPYVDLYAGFTLANLIPKVGKPADARNLTLGINVRY